MPRIAFKERELVFGCDGDMNKKPYATACVVHFKTTGQNTWFPDRDTNHYMDVHKYYHRRESSDRNFGTHFVCGFRLVTRDAGRYRTTVTYVTDEREGEDELWIRVEDEPQTCMKRDSHWECGVTPTARVERRSVYAPG